MNNRITIGQYLPGDSPVHTLDARIKLLIVLAFMVAAFLIETFTGYAILTVSVLCVTLVAQIPLMRLLKGLKPIFIILLFTFFINVIFTPGHVLFSLGFIKFTEEGLLRATFIAIRLVLLVIGTSILTLTTSPLELTDGIAALLSPLRVVHFPSQVIAMMISIALRFIPTLFDETDKIMRAQKARGADFESGNIIERAKAMIPLFVPLFLNAITRADELGVAMEARCYTGSEHRTRLNPLVMKPRDRVVFIATLAFFVVLCFFF
ncbi:MAG: energy-coupling factor transporter transmembrane component T [Peptoniphilaceae bacterium]|nr:energy-coupling factor transporter transmembrane component T [Peptoniphilaceae bacterium]MDY6085189.1 energy-coupling factor transporter transmembrane component T [Peptoniphilaceae bacterium]